MSTLDNSDLKAIKSLMIETIDEKVEDGALVTRDDISHLPTKDDFYQRMDDLVTEVKASREENKAYTSQIKRLSDKVDHFHPTN